VNRAAALSTVALCFAPLTASAEGWEISILGGWTAPTFEERVVFRPDIDLPDIPGGAIRQECEIALDAVGSFAFGASLSYYFNQHLALEGRIDTIDVDIDTIGPRFEAEVNLVPGFPLATATAALDVGAGTVEVQRLFPLSLDLKARSGGSVRFTASGGISYLPRVRFDAVQPVSLEIGGFGIPPIELAAVVLQAGAVDSGESRWGFNAGAGMEIQVSPKVALVGDLRVHGFPSQTFVWRRSRSPSSPLDEILYHELESLPPIEIRLIYFQATGGVSFRF
jgi:Outer membrane protein beta-barrel domain